MRHYTHRCYIQIARGERRIDDVQITGFVAGAVLSFWINTNRAIKEMAISAGAVIIIYLFGIFFNLI